jgi:integrase
VVICAQLADNLESAREAVGLPGLHFHDLRHTGGTLTATIGATLSSLGRNHSDDAEAARQDEFHV